MMDAQMEPGLKKERSDHVLENDGTVDRLREQVADLLRLLMTRAGKGGA
jgi:dephospho-CoA kinase